jgi:hypothetical protein
MFDPRSEDMHDMNQYKRRNNVNFNACTITMPYYYLLSGYALALREPSLNGSCEILCPELNLSIVGLEQTHVTKTKERVPLFQIRKCDSRLDTHTIKCIVTVMRDSLFKYYFYSILVLMLP